MATVASTSAQNVLIPLQLDAFVLNEATCDAANKYKICPITQPNYTFLRLTDNLLTADILEHVDLHSVQPAALNSRLTDLGSSARLQNRLGVYVKWTLPPIYRTGAAVADATTQQKFANHNTSKIQQGYPSQAVPYEQADTTTPQMRSVPNRWLVVRRIRQKLPTNAAIPDVQAWIVESDRVRNINDQELSQADLETDVTPFLNYDSTSFTDVIEGQAEVFIGKKSDYDAATLLTTGGNHIDLNVLSSANPLFADYQPHNCNVFSMIDNFGWIDSASAQQYLYSATAEYQVIGWHSDFTHDPFYTDVSAITKLGVKIPSHQQRMKDCSMRLKAPLIKVPSNVTSATPPTPNTTPLMVWAEDPNYETAWLDDGTPTRTLSHATIYGVEFMREADPRKGLPANMPAQQAANLLQNTEPIAVGVTPLDALLAYCRVHDTIDRGNLAKVESDIERIQLLLRAQENDGVDGLQAAADESYEQAFQRTEGETHWYFFDTNPPSIATSGSNPPVTPTASSGTNVSTTMQDGSQQIIPTASQLALVRTLNNLQRGLDITNRELNNLSWQLFAQWWNFVSGFIAASTDGQARFKQQLISLKLQLGMVQACFENLNTAVTTTLNQFGAAVPKKGTGARYYQRKDPTILFGNVQSGWDPTFSDLLPVRTQKQVVVSDQAAKTGTFNHFVSKLPSEISAAAEALLQEFDTLASGQPQALQQDQTIPWFHQETLNTRAPRDLWSNTQPWQPLFVEWEAIYYHIPWKMWRFRKSGLHHNWGSKVYRYVVDDDLAGVARNDSHTVTGRILIMPQVAGDLRNTLQQIFSSTNPQDLIDKWGMPQSEQDFILANVAQLQFLSSPLTGLTSSLLTLQDGSHFKPTLSVRGLKPTVIDGTWDRNDLKEVGFTANDILAMQTNTSSTPYGATAVNPLETPLKLVTHGQLVFTKINIVDKFGQAICAIDPKPHHRNDPVPTISPILGESYFPNIKGGISEELAPSPPGPMNTVLDASSVHSANAASLDQNPFIQLTPAINQPSRINGDFCVSDGGIFRPAAEWENPIWGWLVVNYADYGLQIFLQDGTFYREVRVGGPTQTSAGIRWLPFDPPQVNNSTTPVEQIRQLDFLLAKLTQIPAPGQSSYLQGFFDMITQSIDENQAHAPTSYATYSTAIIGKPLALVNVGYSLELAGRECQNWSIVNTMGPQTHLLNDPANPSKETYQFPMKLGDFDRTFDGLVGYFKTTATTNTPPSNPALAARTSNYDLDHLYTYFAKDLPTTATTKTGDPRIQLDAPSGEHFEILQPYWAGLPPTTTIKGPVSLAAAISATHTSHLQIFGVLLDPFLPIHAYTAILPNHSLKLPAWTIEAAMSRMTAFWHAGPLVVTADLPSHYDPTHPLDAAYTAAMLNPPTPEDVAAPLTAHARIPLARPVASQNAAGAVWKWLQPFRVLESKTGGVQEAGMVQEEVVTRFNAFDVDGDAAGGGEALEVRLDGGPYTALEGFVQLVKPVVGT